MSSARILVVDDEAPVRSAVRRLLEQLGYEVEEATGCRGAELALRRTVVDAAVLDYDLGDGTALDIIPRLQSHVPRIPVVVLTGHGSIELAVRCIQEGADHFLTKPIDLPALSAVVARLVATGRNERRHAAEQSREESVRRDPFIGRSKAIQTLEEQARRIASSDATVLIQGETGSGKGILARWIHESSNRSEEPLMELNCAALTRDLLESELFGHRKGAFTGAVDDKVGLLEAAHRGTVLLDEIGDIAPSVQPKLLKVLEDKRIRRVGDVEDRSVDVRILAATHRDLGEAASNDGFRSDLYYRISTVGLRVPPLRSRPEDIPELAEAILNELAAAMGRLSVQLQPDAVERLQAYPWPGNIRELRNVLERAVLLSATDELAPADLHFDDGGSEPSLPFADLTLDEMQRRHIERALRIAGGTVVEAARRLDIPRSTLYDHIHRYEIDLSDIRTTR